MWSLKLLLVPVLLYLSILLLVWSFQSRILFPVSSVQPADPLPEGSERLVLDTPDGERLHGVHIAAKSGTGSGPVILGFGGNAWNAEEMAAYLHDLYPRADVVAFHYRGYAPSSGAPGAEALVADAPLVFDLVAERVPGRPVVAVGFSIGSGVAASLAGRRPVAGLILVTPFDSLMRVASDHYPWLPVRLLFRNEMDAAGRLRSSPVPTALIAGEADSLIPQKRTEALRRSVANLVFDRAIPRAGHNDIYRLDAFQQAMREALGRIVTGGS
jgi:pimeloyl-ACP methyl ester carboxylesterase